VWNTSNNKEVYIELPAIFLEIKGSFLTEQKIKEKLEEYLFLAYGFEILRAELKISQEIKIIEFDIATDNKINEYIYLEKIGECQIKF